MRNFTQSPHSTAAADGAASHGARERVSPSHAALAALARSGVHCGGRAPARALRPPGALHHRARLRRVVRMALRPEQPRARRVAGTGRLLTQNISPRGA